MCIIHFSMSSRLLLRHVSHISLFWTVGTGKKRALGSVFKTLVTDTGTDTVDHLLLTGETFERPHGKTNNLHMRKQRCRSASR